MKMLSCVALMVAMTALSGCKMELATDLYSSDLRLTASGDEGLFTPATLSLPITTKDKCAEETAKIVAIMQGIVDPFEPKGCTRKQMDSFMLADIQIPLVDSEDAWEETDALFGIISQHGADTNDRIYVFVMMDLDQYKILSERVRNEFHQSLKLDQSGVSMVVNNDERNDISINVPHAFVQGIPELGGIYDIKRRGQLEIELSNVSVAALGREGFALSFMLMDEAGQS